MMYMKKKLHMPGEFLGGKPEHPRNKRGKELDMEIVEAQGYQAKRFALHGVDSAILEAGWRMRVDKSAYDTGQHSDIS